VRLNDSGVWGDEPQGTDDVIVLRSTDIALDGTWTISDPAARSIALADRRAKTLQEGDLVVVTSSGSAAHLGKTALVTQEVAALQPCFSNFVQRLRPNERADGRYLYYLLNSTYGGSQLEMLGTTSTGLRTLNGTILGAIRCTARPRAEQRKIADFLDAETARIVALIEKKRRMVTLLEEQRKEFIARTVTFGLDANARLFDTGNRFAPRIPVGWRLMRLKHVVRRIVDTEHATAPIHEDGKYLVVRTANVKGGRLVLGDAKYTDEAGWRQWTRRAAPAPGDVMLTREAPAGEACIVPDDIPLCIGQRVVLLVVDQAKVDGSWLVHSLYGGPAQTFVSLLSRSTTVAHINMADIPDVPIVVPPLDVQRQLLTKIHAEVDLLETLAALAAKQIILLREHRQALITAAVTGERNVVEAAARRARRNESSRARLRDGSSSKAATRRATRTSLTARSGSIETRCSPSSRQRNRASGTNSRHGTAASSPRA